MDDARKKAREARERRRRYEAELRDEYRKKNDTQAVVRANEPRAGEDAAAHIADNHEQALVRAPLHLPPQQQHKKQVHWSNEPIIIPDSPSTVTTNTNTATNVAMSDAIVVNGPTNIESFTVNNYNGGKDRAGANEVAAPDPVGDMLGSKFFWWSLLLSAGFGALYWLMSGVRDVVSGAGVAVLGAGTSAVATAVSVGLWLLATVGLGEGLRADPGVSSNAPKAAAAANIKPLVNHLPEMIAVVEWSDSAAHAVSDTAGYDMAGMAEMGRLEAMAETLREKQRVTNEEWTEDVRERKAAARGLITQFQDLATDAEAAEESSQLRCWLPWLPKPALCTVHDRLLMRSEQAAEMVKTTGGLWRRRIAEDDTSGGGVLDQTPAEARKVCQHSGVLQVARSQMRRRLLDGKTGGESQEAARLQRGLVLLEDQNRGLRMACHVANKITREAKDVHKSLKGDVNEMRVMENGLLMTRQAAEDGDIDDVRAAGRVLGVLNQFVAMLERWEVDV